MPTSTCELLLEHFALYLNDFGGEHSQEMRFRLALFGAWHLADGPDGRRSVRKTLRDAYDDASTAVHLGKSRMAGAIVASIRTCRMASDRACKQNLLVIHYLVIR